MKLRLQITTSPDSTFPFEHPGPTIRIGRNPESDLTFASSINQVSWNHARIDLGSKGAFLTDLDSTNGTFVNDRRISGKTTVKQGDHVQLGHTGPFLKILEVDLLESARVPGMPAMPAAVLAPPPLTAAPPPALSSPLVQVSQVPAPPPAVPDPTRDLVDAVHRTQRNALLGIGVVIISVLFLALVLFWKFGLADRGQKSANGEAAASQAKGTEPGPRANDTATGAGKPSSGTASTVTTPPVANKPPPETPPVTNGKTPPPSDPNAPRTGREDIGRYVAPEKDPPSVLVERQTEPYPWGRLKPQSPLYTGKYLVSLPGYRSKVYTNSNVHLTLWGNLPEFSNFPPVLESAVMLHPAGPGTDLDFTLDRGRVHLRNFKGQQPAQVRVRFFKEIWDLTLSPPDSEAVLELWSTYPREVPFSKEPGGEGPVATVGLIVKGQASLKTGDREFPLPNLSYYQWLSKGRAPAGPQTLASLPPWWTDKIETKTPQIADVALTLKDYSTLLNKSDAVVDGLRTQIKESDDGTNRQVGVLFLGAVDDIFQLIDLLEDVRHAEVRGTAAFALRNWISRGRDQELELYRMLYEKKGFSREKAEIIMQLLHYFSDQDLARPETYQTLIGYLDHENLAIRELAFWHLAHLVSPETLARLPKDKVYDPNAPVARRKPAVDEWKRLIPPGKVPPRPSPAAR